MKWSVLFFQTFFLEPERHLKISSQIYVAIIQVLTKKICKQVGNLKKKYVEYFSFLVDVLSVTYTQEIFNRWVFNYV